VGQHDITVRRARAVARDLGPRVTPTSLRPRVGDCLCGLEGRAVREVRGDGGGERCACPEPTHVPTIRVLPVTVTSGRKAGGTAARLTLRRSRTGAPIQPELQLGGPRPSRWQIPTEQRALSVGPPGNVRSRNSRTGGA